MCVTVAGRRWQAKVTARGHQVVLSNFHQPRDAAAAVLSFCIGSEPAPPSHDKSLRNRKGEGRWLGSRHGKHNPKCPLAARASPVTVTAELEMEVSDEPRLPTRSRRPACRLRERGRTFLGEFFFSVCVMSEDKGALLSSARPVLRITLFAAPRNFIRRTRPGDPRSGRATRAGAGRRGTARRNRAGTRGAGGRGGPRGASRRRAA